MERHELQPRLKVGFYTLIMRVNSSKKIAASIRKRWRVECVCGKRETVPESYLVRKPNPKTHCGCQIPVTNKTKYNREYRIWCMMRQRCYTSTHVAYKDYGGRGIRICDAWLGESGFENFLKFIGPAPSLDHSIDRVDVNGNYEPHHPISGKVQVRWATRKEQAANTRPALARKAALASKSM